MKKTAILTWHYYNNFGSALQAFALQESIEKLGVEVAVLNYRNKKYNGKAIMQIARKFDLLNRVLCSVFHKEQSYKFHAFRKKYLHESKQISDEQKLCHVAHQYRTIVVGSDQIWAPNAFNPVYMINFANGNNVKKVSYAASIGLDRIPDDLVNTYRELLSDFCSVSVRETMGKSLLSERCGIQSEVVLDPTLLLSAEQYRSMETEVCGIKTPFVFCYFLKEDNTYRNQVEQFAKENALAVYGHSANPADADWMNICADIGPSEFLWLVEHAGAVFTDSYHGTTFSLLFHKELYVFERFSHKDPICQNSRIRQLDAVFGIGSRFLSNEKTYTQCQAYDYDQFDEKLAREQAASLEFLKKWVV